MMESSMLKIDGKVPPHNFWFFKFCSLFEQDLEKLDSWNLDPKDTDICIICEKKNILH